MENNDNQKRLLLALGLCFALTTLYMLFFAPSKPVVAPPPLSAAVDAGSAEVARSPVPLRPPEGLERPPVAAPSSALPVRTLAVDREEAHYVFSTEGAGLLSAVLEGPKMRDVRRLTWQEGVALFFGKEQPPAPQMDLARPVPGAPLPLAISVTGAAPIPGTLRYAAQAGDHSLTFTGRTAEWEIVKVFRWTEPGFELRESVRLRNLTRSPLSGELGVSYGRAIDPAHEEKPSFFGGVGNLSDAACAVKDDFEKHTSDDKPPKEFRGPLHFVGVNQQYFLSAIFPLDGAREGRCVLSATATAREASAFFPFQVAPGETVTQEFGVFLGPKESEVLEKTPAAAPGLPRAGVSPHLERTIDFGIWTVLCRLMLPALTWIHAHVVSNWGVAIILLTVVVKVLLVPLTHRAMVSQEAMKKLQPKLEAIKKKHPSDRERQQMETMKVYQEAGVNPFGSCLMLLVQLPVWASLFYTLRNSYDIYGAPFLHHFLPDLTVKDPTYLLPLLMGVSQIITQRLQPAALDAAQQRLMTWFMPIFFTAIMVNYPAGLLLYIFTNNVLTVLQQYGLRRWLQRGEGGGGQRGRRAAPLKPALEKRK